MDEKKWRVLTAHLAKSVMMLQNRVRQLEAVGDARARWLCGLLEKDREFQENLEKMPEGKKEITMAILRPAVTEDGGTSMGLISAWDHNDYLEEEEKLRSLIAEMIQDEE